ncbi:DUF523 domain-containing protein [Halomonas elongata]|uniref:DUF523 domain-containing protein n=1 Tax=Halomonas elongata TaxID=2746 RepID=UPI004033FC9C
MEKLLISACLLGQPVRYDGRAKTQQSDILARWRKEGRLVTVCPEVQAGLATPRAPAEIEGGGGAEVLAREARVMTRDGEDVSVAFRYGADLALALCRRHRIRFAILTEGSPSCGSQRIYDGCFDGHTVAGMGVTTALLTQYGIRVFNQEEIARVAALL